MSIETGTRWWQALAAGLAHSVLVIASFAPFGLSAVILLSPLPLIWVGMRPAKRPGVVALWVWVGNLAWWLFEQQFIVGVTAVGFGPMVALLASYEAVFVWLLIVVRRRWAWLPVCVAAPVLWIGLEFLRAEVVLTGYAMLVTAHPLIDAGPVGGASRLAWLIGTYGVGLAVLVWAGGVGDVVWGRKRLWGSGAIAVFLILSLGGLLVSAPEGGSRRARIAVVQTNVAQSNKIAWSVDEQLADWASFVELTREAAGQGPDVIVWPETMFPGIALEDDAIATERAARLSWELASGERLATTYFYDALMALSREVGVPMLVGAVGVEGLRFEESGEGVRTRVDGRYNSVFLVDDGRVVGARYDKMELTPFGEVMPGISAWAWLERQLMAIGAGGMSFDLEAGRRAVVFEIEGADGPFGVATPICFEATIGGQCRRLLRGGEGARAGVMVNVTNDGWFGDFDAGRRHHLLSARWRCLELRTPMVRAANTGISAWINASGRVVEELEPRTSGVLVADVAVRQAPAPSGLIGLVIAWGCAGATIVAMAWGVGGWVRARTWGRSATNNGSTGGQDE
jgi:apolipoprotein N-acyltransferase